MSKYGYFNIGVLMFEVRIPQNGCPISVKYVDTHDFRTSVEA